MRQSPPTPPPPIVDRTDRQIVLQRRRYELITPLFGGGVAPAQADPVTVVRATEVRGHLRFWWRACRGGLSGGDGQAMKDAEDRLWGAASTSQNPRPSLVQVQVEVVARGQDDQPYEVRQGPIDPRTGRPRPQIRPRQGSVSPAYVSFPLQPRPEELGTAPIKAVKVGVAFMLTISFPESCRADVEAALWAWETFGGLGARTRRGFGALRCAEINGSPVSAPVATDVEATIRNGIATHVRGERWPDNVPHLGGNSIYKVTAVRESPLAAWSYLIGELTRFRQARTEGPMGRSQWPEPEAIRARSGQRLPRHAPLPVQIAKFPRAAFGLPIVFHFKDGRDRDRMHRTDVNIDPRDTVLQGATPAHDRLASPLILRPLACSGGKAVGLALVLDAPATPPGGFALKDNLTLADVGTGPIVSALTPGEAAQIKPLQLQANVLHAFLNTLR